MVDTFWLVWWVWGIAALVLVIVEVLLPGFIALGFGIGAGVIAALILVVPDFSLAPSLMLLLFAALSLGAWLVLHRLFSLPSGQVKHFDHDIND